MGCRLHIFQLLLLGQDLCVEVPVPPLLCITGNPSVFSGLKNIPFPLILELKKTPITLKSRISRGSKATLFSGNADDQGSLIVIQHTTIETNIIN